ncbi:MAG: GNAT superfamily N-acetyltransferase [Saprospiraceae bacterium]|jgi:GNAT superfamily N-acetyltransferase|tara:strand:- start:518 stop:1072 length:555 start_codon:yes stop_codon:yes gene_type:complete
MVSYATAKSRADLNQILDLQKANLKSSISLEECEKDGFVTLSHDFELLKELNTPYPHIIAMDGSNIVGYALVTTLDKVSSIPLLQTTIEELIGVKYHGTKVLEMKYFIMGQVCIHKSYRGQGIFQGLYQKMKDEMKSDFEIIITEITTDNKRSMRAHEKVGFEILKIHSENDSDWALVGLNLRK